MKIYSIKEIAKILSKLTDSIRKVKENIFESYNIEKKYEFHFTIAWAAYQYGGIKPQFNTGGLIELNKVDWKGLEKGYYFLYQPLEKGGLTIQIETENEFDPKMLTLICTEFVMPNKIGCFI